MNQFDLNLQALINDMPIVLGDTMLELGLDAKVLIQQRVQEKGLNASGGATPKYSEKYALYRAKNGRQVSFMDLTLTGDMWASTGVVNKEQNGNETKVTVAGRDEFAQMKIDANSKRFFEVLKLSKEEEVVLQENFSEQFTEKIIEYLNRNIE